MTPDDMMLVRIADLVALLNVAIARGEDLGYHEADNDYRQWLAEIVASTTPPAEQVVTDDGEFERIAKALYDHAESVLPSRI